MSDVAPSGGRRRCSRTTRSATSSSPSCVATGRAGARCVDAARIEAGLRAFLEQGGFGAFTDTFEDLHGMRQLPGIAVQRLMADGYGFGGEGDWKTAALVRILKVMATGLAGGTSFMEDYTYDLSAERAAGARLAHARDLPVDRRGRPACEIHPLSIGGRDDPVRLVFDAAPGPAVVLALLDLGDRFRLLANEVEVVPPPHALPKLPVARALWKPRPDFATAAEAWLLAGGSHHTVFTAALDAEVLDDFAEIAGVELLLIDEDTRMRAVPPRAALEPGLLPPRTGILTVLSPPARRWRARRSARRARAS